MTRRNVRYQSTAHHCLANMGGLTRILTVLLCLSPSQAFRLARLVTEEVADSKTVKINDGIKFENGVLVTDDPKGYRATTVKTIKTDNGIKFENGVLVRDSSTVKTLVLWKY